MSRIRTQNEWFVDNCENAIRMIGFFFWIGMVGAVGMSCALLGFASVAIPVYYLVCYFGG